MATEDRLEKALENAREDERADREAEELELELATNPSCEVCGDAATKVLIEVAPPVPKMKPYTILRDLCPRCRTAEQARINTLCGVKG